MIVCSSLPGSPVIMIIVINVAECLVISLSLDEDYFSSSLLDPSPNIFPSSRYLQPSIFHSLITTCSWCESLKALRLSIVWRHVAHSLPRSPGWSVSNSFVFPVSDERSSAGASFWNRSLISHKIHCPDSTDEQIMQSPWHWAYQHLRLLRSIKLVKIGFSTRILNIIQFKHVSGKTFVHKDF